MKTFALLILLCTAIAHAATGDDPLAPWRSGVNIHPVSTEPGRHTIHAYFNATPESPDGRWVLFYASSAPDAHTNGEIRILERATGKERILARNITAEDAHRAACQHWISGGRRVVFHDWRDKEWIVCAADVETAKVSDVAHNRQLGWGQPNADVVPLYSPHANPGEHRDLELLNVETGKTTTPVTADAVKAAYPEFIAKTFGDKPISIFFPILSPDLKRVFFKMSTPGTGDVRSWSASERQGLVCYDLEKSRFLFLRQKWGHPAWHPDSHRIVEAGYLLIDTDTGKTERLAGLPPMGSGHPSASSDGKLLVTDLTMDHLGGDARDWAVVVADVRGNDYVIIHKFDNSHGASSWRRSHPHPAFSPDGKRIYFNVSSTKWTQLHVAEAGKP
jgi:WD40 repeat protein